MSLRIEFHAELDSTQRRAHELVARGVSTWDAVCADHQTAGRGRQGAHWYDTPNQSLLVSLILREVPLPQPVGLLATFAALATADVLQRHYPALPLVQLKYPNDLILCQRKLGGVLAELMGQTAIVGVGVNLAQRQFPAPLQETAISVYQALSGVDQPAPYGAIVSRDERAQLIEAIYYRLQELLTAWQQEPSYLVSLWHARDASVGRTYRIHDLPEQPIAVAVGIEPDFRLRLRLPNGITHATYFVSAV
ncbi:MAG: biotin--[acetyl-CoA-carboxylase] ligase [Fimbriimonadales bacterium]|nr:biotin--[acetyl-CoA-carboxylase] ligase [Fimbriimonadales bacterium]MDW8052475.1 biotin--[acetyl-CoA-carboxylase] ligase [Armatimonadota bacterium]